MLHAVSNFAKSKANGLCLIDMPTGTGKTYQTKEFIKKFIKGEVATEADLIIYLTPLRKNIDDIYYDLKNDFDDQESFESNVLRIYSNYECVLENLLDLDGNIQPTIKRKESYKNLKSKILAYKELAKNPNIPKELLATNLKEIRTNYEPPFRHDLEAELHKEAKTKSEKKKKINHEYSWVKTLYPSCLTDQRKVLFMTMDKFLFGNDPIISNPYKFLSYPKIKGSLIFIDEFDATKDVILNQEIEKSTNYKIDLTKLFSTIATSLKGKKVPEAIFASSEDSKKSFEKMKDVMLKIESEYKLDYIFKLESIDNSDRYFLFDDYQIHTIASGNKESKITIKNEVKKNQNTILIGNKDDDGKFYRAIYGMKSALNYFIRYCSMLSRNYMNHHNENAVANHSDMMEIEQAVSTIIDYFNLDSELAKTVSSLILDDISLPNEARKRDVFSTDFYMNGFRYYDFNDDISHDVSTSISMCYLNNTPEKYMISLANKARVVGLSATASIQSVTGNYNLEYIKTKIKDAYYDLPLEDKTRIKKYVEKQLMCNYQINVKPVCLDDYEPSTIAAKLLSKESSIEEATGWFEQNVSSDSKDPNYENGRLAKILLAIKGFLSNKNSKVILILTNRNIKTQIEGGAFSLEFIKKIITLMSRDVDVEMPKIFYLFGSDFDTQKDAYQSEVKEGKKVILFSSYQSVGTGQNLQYEVYEGEESFKKQKDIDSIYVEYPTNILVHKDSLKEEGSLNKYIYQMETLRANGEIPPYSSMLNIKSAFKQYISFANKGIHFDNVSYSSVSTNNHIVKILVQAIGRICRTKNKDSNHQANIFVDNVIMNKVDFRFMKSRLMNPEFEKIVALSEFKPEHNMETLINLNKAVDCNLRVNKRIENILSDNKTTWNTDDIAQWNLIRETILKYPTISREKLKELSMRPGLESIKDFYLYAREGQKIYCYRYSYKKDNDTIKILYGNEADKENGETLIDAKSSRLFTLLKSAAVREHFAKNGYATSFEMNDCIILPVVYQNIYKGAIGEQAGRAILESKGIFLDEITDPEKFEKFDFCCSKNHDVYIDFKNWSEQDREERDPYKLKSYNKLETVGGKKAFIINMVASEYHIHDDGDIVEVSSLFKYKNENYYELGYDLIKLANRILEACKNGNQ